MSIKHFILCPNLKKLEFISPILKQLISLEQKTHIIYELQGCIFLSQFLKERKKKITIQDAPFSM